MSSQDIDQSLQEPTTPEGSVSIATFNTHGIRGKEPDVERLASQVQVLGVCETWLRPQDLFTHKFFSESVCVQPTHNGWRGQGGIGLKLNPLINYSVIQKHAEAAFQFVLIRIGGTCIAMVYIAPNVSRPEFQQCLTAVKTAVVGKGVIMGDLNCRHKQWDKKCSTQGVVSAVGAEEQVGHICAKRAHICCS